MSKFKIVDAIMNCIDITGGEIFETQTDAETWIKEFANDSEDCEIIEDTENE